MSVEPPQPDAIAVEPGSGNVFADLGLPHPEVALAKADLAISLAAIMEARGWTPEKAATATGVEAAALSAALRGDLADVSIDALLRALAGSGQEVRIGIAPDHSGHGAVKVSLTLSD